MHRRAWPVCWAILYVAPVWVPTHTDGIVNRQGLSVCACVVASITLHVRLSLMPPHTEGGEQAGCSQPAPAGPFAAKLLAKHLSHVMPASPPSGAGGCGFELRLGGSHDHASMAMPVSTAWIGGIVRAGPSASLTDAFVVDDGTGASVRVTVPKSCQTTGEAALAEGSFALVIGVLKSTKRGLQIKAQKVGQSVVLHHC